MYDPDGVELPGAGMGNVEPTCVPDGQLKRSYRTLTTFVPTDGVVMTVSPEFKIQGDKGLSPVPLAAAPPCCTIAGFVAQPGKFTRGFGGNAASVMPFGELPLYRRQFF